MSEIKNHEKPLIFEKQLKRVILRVYHDQQEE